MSFCIKSYCIGRLKTVIFRKLSSNVQMVKFLQFRTSQSTDTKVGFLLPSDQDKPKIFTLNSRFNSMIDFIKCGNTAEQITTVLKQPEKYIPIEDVIMLAPITGPDKVICIGPNFRKGFDKQKKKYPSEPLVFNKYPSCIIGPREKIVLPKNSSQVEFEAELAVIIGKAAKYVQQDEAEKYIFGYTIAQDISARDWQRNRNHGQWLLGKAMDTFCPLGPHIIPKEYIQVENLDITTEVNGEIKQEGNTSDMIFNVKFLVSYLSETVTLYPGDIILTGTPPYTEDKCKKYLEKGDVLTSKISCIGELINVCS